jgi:dimeric dUTPase (all-alpha-NTP-PPase superfamily)
MLTSKGIIMSLEKFKWMVDAQTKVNSVVSEDWITKGRRLEFDFKLAASQEMAEFFNSYGYSWWSKSPRDMDNAITEIIDAWHFILSEVIIAYGVEFAPSILNNSFKVVTENNLLGKDDTTVKYQAKLLVGLLNTDDSLDKALDKFFQLTTCLSLSLDYLYLRYMGKNCLNVFRQENGYKKGEYTKIWHGKEDNFHLVRFLDNTDSINLSYTDVRRFLTAKYAEVVKPTLAVDENKDN